MNAVPFIIDRPQIVHRVVRNVVASIVPTASEAMLFDKNSYRGPQVTAWMRQVAMYVMHRRFGAGLNKVAKLFARDRSSVLHGVYQVEDACQDSYLTSAFVAFVEHQARTLLDDIQATETETGVLPSEYASVGGRRG
ncbi:MULTISPECIES: helix-turn-helix domain-containing protein [Phyllobacteriaceae]|jgi:Bacterial dnaA protein helix-turn-helix|uniref:Chromosomal replication initiator DnaA C-terminal domain-containing protein n=1 Tax=Mesorhizobium hungaricum TaxID=1566387 RepID=A0A1C2DES4_9HYPH|nr:MULTISPECIES: helix-turn-helix domain-containing protein [Mesorhizobium]MBN9232736.1 hypothetical protein [Mesorhizobium sp.]MDQ0330335.1 hypothetical protein [Mesorhizobium sp. YL-MeA3-2017]MDU8502925.1 helix-turn-helix domain-containing protein [Pseudomonas syringae]OCX13165.1 hypothetical protein QV13_26930 [Mesorhizobium hungaricum]